MGFEETMDTVARGVEVLGIATLVLGLAAALALPGSPWSGVKAARRATRSSEPCSGAASCWAWSFWSRPTSSGPSPVEPSLENVAVLGLIVLIRTLLSFSLEVEIDGRWPWRRAMPLRSRLSTSSPDTSEPDPEGEDAQPHQGENAGEGEIPRARTPSHTRVRTPARASG